MPGYPLGQALAASEAGGQELEAVGLVGGRAGGADRHPAVAAALEEGGVRLPVSRIHTTDLTSLRVGLLDLTAQAYRVSAVAGLSDLLHPAVIARTGPSDGLGHHLRQDLTDPNRLGHVGLPCVWPAPDVGMIAVEDRHRGAQV